MGDDESRREDARIEAHIDRALLNGTWGYCFWCNDPTPYRERDEESEEFGRWVCRPCQRMMDNPGD